MNPSCCTLTIVGCSAQFRAQEAYRTCAGREARARMPREARRRAGCPGAARTSADMAAGAPGPSGRARSTTDAPPLARDTRRRPTHRTIHNSAQTNDYFYLLYNTMLLVKNQK